MHPARPSQSLLGTMLGASQGHADDGGRAISFTQEKVQAREEVVDKMAEFVTEFASVQELGIFEQNYEGAARRVGQPAARDAAQSQDTEKSTIRPASPSTWDPASSGVLGSWVASPVLTRLERILDLEEKQGWRNRRRHRRLAGSAERWSADASAEGWTRHRSTRWSRHARDGAATPQTARRSPRRSGARRPATTPPAQTAGAGRAARPAATEAQVNDDAATPLEIPAGEGTAAACAGTGQERPPGRHDGPPWPGYGLRGRRGDGTMKTGNPAAGATHVNPGAHCLAEGLERRNPQDLQARATIISGVGRSDCRATGTAGHREGPRTRCGICPARYDDFSQIRTIDSLRPGEQVTIIANLWDVRERKIGMNRAVVQGILGDSTGTLNATWWNKWDHQQNSGRPGSTLRFSGKVRLYMGQKTLDKPGFEDLDEERGNGAHVARLPPPPKVLNNRLRTLIFDALDAWRPACRRPAASAFLRAR